jgi:predicted transposase
MKITRTTLVRIDLPLYVAERTAQEWSDTCNYASQIAFDGNISNPIKLYHAVYKGARTNFSLSSQVTISALRVVSATYAAAKTRQVKPAKPVFFKPSGVMLQGGVRGRDFSFTHNGLSVWTVAGRLKPIPYHGGAN